MKIIVKIYYVALFIAVYSICLSFVMGNVNVHDVKLKSNNQYHVPGGDDGYVVTPSTTDGERRRRLLATNSNDNSKFTEDDAQNKK